MNDPAGAARATIARDALRLALVRREAEAAERPLGLAHVRVAGVA